MRPIEWILYVAVAAAILPGCSGEPGDERLATETAAVAPGAIERVVPLRFIRVGDGASAALLPSDETIRDWVEAANSAFSRAGVEFTIASVGRADGPRDFANNTGVEIPRDAMLPVTRAAGIPDDWSAGLSRSASGWRARMNIYFGTDQVNVFVVDWGDSASGIGGDSYPSIRIVSNAFRFNMTHELGHLFGLNHTFEAPIDCRSWDLLFNQVTGTTRRFYTSRADCDANFPSSTTEVHRIEPRSNGTRSVTSSGVITFSPSCTGVCTQADTYQTGDSRVVGYTRVLGQGTAAKNGVNAMTYYSAFPDDQLQYFSDSQIELVRGTNRKNFPIDETSKGSRTFLGRTVADNPLYPLDFDGDGKRDIATWEPPTGVCTSSGCPTGKFVVLLSSHSYSPSVANTITRSFGKRGDVPVLADYDGDGLADLATFGANDADATDTATYWRYCPSSLSYDCARSVSKRFGLRGDVPLPRTNFHGTLVNGEAAVYRPSTGDFYYAPMCTPGTSGTTTCSTLWYGPFHLGDAESQLMPDLWDGDDRTDFAVYDARTATLKIRRSETGWATVTRNLGSEYAVGTSTTTEDSALHGVLVLPQYQPYGSPAVPRRTFAMYHFGLRRWLNRWAWWDANASTQRCVFCDAIPFTQIQPISALDLDNDKSSDKVAVVPLASGGAELRIRTGAGCGGTETTDSLPLTFAQLQQLVPVSDMTGDGSPDAMAIDDAAGRIVVLDAKNGFSMADVISFGGPHIWYL